MDTLRKCTQMVCRSKQISPLPHQFHEVRLKEAFRYENKHDKAKHANTVAKVCPKVSLNVLILHLRRKQTTSIANSQVHQSLRSCGGGIPQTETRTSYCSALTFNNEITQKYRANRAETHRRLSCV